MLAGATASEVESVVQRVLASANVSGATIDLDPSNPDLAQRGGPMTVSVNVPFNSVSWLPAPMFLGNTNLTAQSVMRNKSIQAGGN